MLDDKDIKRFLEFTEHLYLIDDYTNLKKLWLEESDYILNTFLRTINLNNFHITFGNSGIAVFRGSDDWFTDYEYREYFDYHKYQNEWFYAYEQAMVWCLNIIYDKAHI